MGIIRMSEAHVEAVANLEKECFSMPWSVDSIRSELSNVLALWIVAVESGKLVGYVGSQSVLGEADMMNLAVSPEFRCRGVGQALVLNLIEQLRLNQVHSLTLEVRVSNQAALRLYDKLGFFEVGRRPNYYTNPKEDALILRKEWEV